MPPRGRALAGQLGLSLQSRGCPCHRPVGDRGPTRRLWEALAVPGLVAPSAKPGASSLVGAIGESLGHGNELSRCLCLMVSSVTVQGLPDYFREEPF